MIPSTVRPGLLNLPRPWACPSCRISRQYAAAVRTISGDRPRIPRPSKTRLPYRNGSSGHLPRYASTSFDRSGRSPTGRGHLPDFPARTRFAPSPTGYLHIGGLRTALFSYLLAKRTKGQFLLRIEDTDQKRLVPDAEARLCADLQWAGLLWDEGPLVGGPYGPYRQSERLELYQQHARQLLDNSTAYRCFCTPSTSGPSNDGARYVTSGCYQDCASLDAERSQERALEGNEPFTVRLRSIPGVRKHAYTDLIYGHIQPRIKLAKNSTAGEDGSAFDASDAILVKSDGSPTYHFANVVDDHLMEITHVIRGTEWMPSTPLHFDLYAAFGWQPPKFAHVPLLVDETQAKLSKRMTSDLVLNVRALQQEQGVLPESLCNFLVLLGWSNPTRNDVLDMRELVESFDLKFTKGNTIVRMEKLWYLQKQHTDRRCQAARSERSLDPIEGLVDRVQEAARDQSASARSMPDDELNTLCANLLLADTGSFETPAQFARRNQSFFAFDPSQVPAEQAVYEPHVPITSNALWEFVRILLTAAELDTKSGDRSSHSPGNLPTTEMRGSFAFSHIQEKSARITAAIDQLIGRIVLDARLVDASAQSDGVISPDNQSHIPARAKAWKRVVWRFLRDKLSHGNHGPGVATTMAILGYEECCRRLNIEPQPNRGW